MASEEARKEEPREEPKPEEPKPKGGFFGRVWAFISEHAAIVLGVVAGLGVLYYLYSSSQSSSSASGTPSTVSFPPTDTGGGGAATTTTTTTTPTTPTATLASWISGISPTLLTDTSSWQSLQAWLTGQSSTVTSGALTLYNELVAAYGAPPGLVGPPGLGTPAPAPTAPPPAPAPALPYTNALQDAWANAYFALPSSAQTLGTWVSLAPSVITSAFNYQQLSAMYAYLNSSAGKAAVASAGGAVNWFNNVLANPGNASYYTLPAAPALSSAVSSTAPLPTVNPTAMLNNTTKQINTNVARA